MQTNQNIFETGRATTNSRVVADNSSSVASEILLLERCKKGESAAWDILIRKYEKSVYKFAYSLCRNHEEAGDIAGHIVGQADLGVVVGVGVIIGVGCCRQ